MATEGDRRKAASLFIILVIFVIFSKVASAMDTIPEKEVSTNIAEVQEESSEVSKNGCNYNLLSTLSENAAICKSEDSLSENSSFGIELVKKDDHDKVKESLQRSEVAKEKVAEKEATRNVSKKESTEFVFEEKTPEGQILSKQFDDANFVAEERRGEYFIYKEPVQYTDEDVLYLARGIHGEAGNQPIMEKYRCGNVMVNRKIDQTGRFPENTIKGILYSSGQFGCIHGSGFFNPTEEEMQIAKNLLNGQCVFPDDIVWFNNTHDYGYFYCKPGYHYFSGYLDHGGKYASAKSTTKVQKVETEIAVTENTTEVEEKISETETTVEEPKEPEEPEVPSEEVLENEDST